MGYQTDMEAERHGRVSHLEVRQRLYLQEQYIKV